MFFLTQETNNKQIIFVPRTQMQVLSHRTVARTSENR